MHRRGGDGDQESAPDASDTGQQGNGAIRADASAQRFPRRDPSDVGAFVAGDPALVPLLVAHIRDGVAIVSGAGDIEMMNPAFAALVERRPEELVGTQLAAIIAAASSVRSDGVAAEAGHERAPNGLPGPVLGAAGQGSLGSLANGTVEVELTGRLATRTVELRTFDLNDGRRLIIAHETTARRHAQQLRARLLHADRLASIGQLAAGVAHEINNPLAYVLSNLGVGREHLERLASLARDWSRPAVSRGTTQQPLLDELAAARELAQRVQELAEILGDSQVGMGRIRTIVRDLLSYSRLGREEQQWVQLNDAVDAACNIAFNEIRHRARLVKDLEKVPPLVGDQAKLIQVLTSLLVNAAHSIEEGDAANNRIVVSTRGRHDLIEINVSDTGCGISEDNLERVFRPFYTTKTEELGTGLGLPLCLDIVRDHGGRIDVTSARGVGSTFTVSLPANRPSQSAPRALPSARSGSLAAAISQTKRARILVIDDDAMVLKAYQRILRNHHEVSIAVGGAEGIAMLADDAGYDAILCDLMMPDVDGPMVYEAVKERVPTYIDHLVFCSGGAFTDRTSAFLERVHNVVLEKPISTDLLLRIIEQVRRRVDPP